MAVSNKKRRTYGTLNLAAFSIMSAIRVSPSIKQNGLLTHNEMTQCALSSSTAQNLRGEGRENDHCSTTATPLSF